MKKVLSFIMLLAIFASTLMSADINLANKSSLATIQKNKELKVGLNAGYMPFEMKSKKGEIIGFDVDIANEMAKAMGVKLNIVQTDWDGIIAGLLSDKYDIIISGITITQERNMKISYSNAYINLGQTLIMNKDLAKKYKSFADIDKKEYTVVSVLGTTGDFAMKKMFKNAKTKTFETPSDAVQEVANGKADIFIFDLTYNLSYMAQQKSNNLVHFEKLLTFESAGFAIKQGDPDFLNWLNHFLNQIKNDGRYDSMYNYWFKDTKWIKDIE